jgi:hypothetical protein
MGMLLPNPFAYLKPTEAGQHDIKQNQSKTIGQSLAQSILTILHAYGLVSVVGQDIAKPTPDGFFVLYD